MPTIKITDEDFATLTDLAERTGVSPAQAFGAMLAQAAGPAAPAPTTSPPPAPAPTPAPRVKADAQPAAPAAPSGDLKKSIADMDKNAEEADAESGKKRAGKKNPLAIRDWAAEPAGAALRAIKKQGLGRPRR